MVVLCLAAALGGCRATGTHPLDPYEDSNRVVFAFNEGFDRWVLGPLATGWDFVMPGAVQQSLVNAFRNLTTPLSALNHALQAEFASSGSELGRFVINSTVGLLGLFDVADAWGIPADRTDFGHTLATWGVPPGPYLVIPFVGPSTARETTGLAMWFPAQTELYHALGLRMTALTAADWVNTRSYEATDLEIARGAAMDYYIWSRTSFLQRRGIEVPGPEGAGYDDERWLRKDDDPRPDDGAPEGGTP